MTIFLLFYGEKNVFETVLLIQKKIVPLHRFSRKHPCDGKSSPKLLEF